MKRENVVVFLCGIVGLLPAACAGGGPNVEKIAAELRGGTLTTARPEVGILDAGDNQCIATLIGNQTILTAARCINYAANYTSGLFFTDDNQYTYIERMFSQGAGGTIDDIAVGHLIHPLDSITPAQIATAEPTAGYYTEIGGSIGRDYVQYYYNGSTPSNIYQNGADIGGPTFAGLLANDGPIVRVALGNTGSSDVGSDPVKFRTQILALDTAFNTDGVSYRGQVQSLGWVPAVTNGQPTGTSGLRLESVQVWSERPGVSVCYQAYVQGTGGWQKVVCDGNVAGTVGQSLPMGAIQMFLNTKPAGTHGIRYNVFFNGAWQGWRADQTIAGGTSGNISIQAIAIQLY